MTLQQAEDLLRRQENPLARDLARWQSPSRTIPVCPSFDGWRAQILAGAHQSPYLNAECWLDAPLEEEADVPVTCLLILGRFQIHGLLLRRIHERENRYERIGVFSSSRFESCFIWTGTAMQTIILT